ncbi:MAG: hypothetical protein WA101_01800 [Minisyncoccia bacterium]
MDSPEVINLEKDPLLTVLTVRGGGKNLVCLSQYKKFKNISTPILVCIPISKEEVEEALKKIKKHNVEGEYYVETEKYFVKRYKDFIQEPSYPFVPITTFT